MISCAKCNVFSSVEMKNLLPTESSKFDQLIFSSVPAMSTSQSTSVPKDGSHLPMGKYLASSDKKTRDKAVKSLAAFLSNTGEKPLSKLDMAKLWKGLFFCFWHSDKPLVQQELATELANMLLLIPTPEAALDFLRGFWEMMVREWTGIDHLRLDKFYMLVRRFVNGSFRLLMSTDWEAKYVDEYNVIMDGSGGPLSYGDRRVPPSISYHLADIYLEELDKVLADTSSRDTPVIKLLSPFTILASRTSNNATYTRLQNDLFEPLLSALSSSKSDDEPRPKRQRLIVPTPPTYSNIISKAEVTNESSAPVEMKKALLRHIFEVASKEDSREANRKKLYSMWKNHKDDSGNLDSDWGDSQ
ncbi:hypothetical protein FRC02_011771 [Tulasnella sp. 418]|nr:hypothetical protein FRC02_011771 [Tulasnella sp. 418]